MKRFITLTTLVALATIVGASTVFAEDPPNFDYLGYVETVPTADGEELKMYGTIVNAGGSPPPPIPLDPAKEYTIVICATRLSDPGGPSSLYSPVTVDIYCDDVPDADYTDTSTFTNGTLILSGSFEGNMTRNDFTSTLGNATGSISWTGGSRLGELGGNTTSWAMIAGISGSSSNIPTGWEECWDGKIDQPTVAVTDDSWSGIKNLYR